MKIIIDVREEGLLEKCQEVMMAYGWTSTTKNIHLENRQLDLGDIIIQTDADEILCVIERKTLYDLLASIQDGRYENQSYRLMHSMTNIPRHNIVYLLEGMMGQIQTADKKRRIYSSITSLVFIKGFSVFRTSSFQETADFIVCMTDKLQRDLAKLPARSVPSVTEPCIEDDTVTEQLVPTTVPASHTEMNTIKSYSTVVKKAKKENINTENIGEILLCQIPSVSNITAQSIMSHFTSFGEFMEELQKNPNLLDGLLIGGSTDGKKRHISKSCIENIKKYLLRTATDDTTATTK